MTELSSDIGRLRIRSDKLYAIEDKQHEVRALKEEWQRKKDGALRAKKAYDEENEELHQLIEQAEDRQLPLPGLSRSELGPLAESPVSIPVPVAEQQSEPEAWRDIPVVDALDLTLKVQDLLEEAEITTMGEFVEADAAGKIRGLKGIGEKTYDKLKDRMVEWLAENQQIAAHVATGEAETDEDQPARIRILETDQEVTVLRWIGSRPVVRPRPTGPEVTLHPEDFEVVTTEESEDVADDSGDSPDDGPDDTDLKDDDDFDSETEEDSDEFDEDLPHDTRVHFGEAVDAAPIEQ